MKYRSSKLTRVSLNIENSVFSTGKDFFFTGTRCVIFNYDARILINFPNRNKFAEIINNFLLFQMLHFHNE